MRKKAESVYGSTSKSQDDIQRIFCWPTNVYIAYCREEPWVWTWNLRQRATIMLIIWEEYTVTTVHRLWSEFLLEPWSMNMEVIANVTIIGDKAHLDCEQYFVLWIDISQNTHYVVLNVDFLTSLCNDVTIEQLFNGLFVCDVILKMSANRCNVGPFVKGHLL